jgi:tRNA threonylcarbamoyladenosine biosynthesis protein TsaB
VEIAIDTSTRYASVAVSEEGRVRVQLSWRSEQNHSVEFVPALRQVMAQAEVTPSHLAAIFVAQGPGGFSALRVGISTAKTMAMAGDVPLVAVGTLDVEAEPYLGLGHPVCAAIPAGRKLLYAASYAPDGAAVEVDYQVLSPDEIAAGAKRDVLFCGEAAPSLAELLEGKGALVAMPQPPTRNPAVLTKLGYQKLQAGETADPASLQPIYMRGSQYDVARRTHGVS